jgi:hypothetical protein
VLDFYKDPNAPFTTKKTKKKWEKVTSELTGLKAFTPSPAPTPPKPSAE